MLDSNESIFYIASSFDGDLATVDFGKQGGTAGADGEAVVSSDTMFYTRP